MKRRQKNLKLRVLFNASVVLSGFRTPKGGSGKLLGFIKNRVVEGKISEVIFDEILKHSEKLSVPVSKSARLSLELFGNFLPAPSGESVHEYKKVVIDEGDAHVIASCKEAKIKYLVTLDKKHLLILKGKIRGLKILTPGELIALIAEK